MKKHIKIVSVFKTHFDIGYTALSSEIIKKYSEEMLPQVISVCNEVKASDCGIPFVWTMSAWPLKVSLENALPEVRSQAEKLIEEGQLVWHALPFTTHTEFLNEKEMVRLFSASDELCHRYGKIRPISAKMTDVPGHTMGLVDALSGYGVKFLHLGCNSASLPPSVPLLFWWESKKGNRVLTFYNSTYGSSLLPPKGWKFPVWLAMLNTNDNVGPQKSDYVISLKEEVLSQAPNAEFTIGTLDDFANELLKCDLSSLPVVREDLGDTWIHGVGTYPKEVGKLRRAKNAVAKIQDSGVRLSAEDEALVDEFYDTSILFGEHTFGLDVKGHLGWKRAYNKKAFNAERGEPRYLYMEESWNEQRRRAEKCAEIASVLTAKYPVSAEPRADVEPCLALVHGEDGIGFKNLKSGRTYYFGLQYGVVGTDDMHGFLRGYLTRFYEWAVADFGRQSYPEIPSVQTVYGINIKDFSESRATAELFLKNRLCNSEYGAVKKADLTLELLDGGVKAVLTLKEKPATPFIEYANFTISSKSKNTAFFTGKTGYMLDVSKDVRKDANQILFCVDKAAENDDLRVETIDAPLVSFGGNAIGRFNGGVSKKRKNNAFYFNLFNNHWGTNFPQWIEADELVYEFFITAK